MKGSFVVGDRVKQDCVPSGPWRRCQQAPAPQQSGTLRERQNKTVWRRSSNTITAAPRTQDGSGVDSCSGTHAAIGSHTALRGSSGSIVSFEVSAGPPSCVHGVQACSTFSRR